MSQFNLKDNCCSICTSIIETIDSWINYIINHQTICYQHKRTDDVINDSTINLQDLPDENIDPIIENYIV